MTGVVLERSRRLCASRYQAELCTPTSYLDAYARMQERLTRQQLAVLAGWYQIGPVPQVVCDLSSENTAFVKETTAT